MANASGRGSFPSNSVGRHSDLSSWLLPPSSSSSLMVPPRRFTVIRVMSVVGLLVSLITMGMIMWLDLELQMIVANFEKQLADHKANLSANLMAAATAGAWVTDKARASQRLHSTTAEATTKSVSLTPSTIRKPEMLECQAHYGAAQNNSVLYPGVFAVRSWKHPSGKNCDSAIGGELEIRAAGSYIVICQAVLSTVDHESVVKGRPADKNITHALRAQLTLIVRVGDTDTLFKSVSNVVLHYWTYQLNAVVRLPADARLAVLLTSFAGLRTNGNISWSYVTIALSPLGGDRPSR